MGRGDIAVQTGFAITLLILSVLALGTTGFTFRVAYERDAYRSGPPPIVTRTYTQYAYSTIYGDGYVSSTHVPITTYTKTVTDSNWYRRQVVAPAAENSTAVVATSATTTVAAVPSTLTPTPSPTTTARPSGAATAIHSSSSSYYGNSRRLIYSSATVGAIINMPWLALLTVYMIAFLLVRWRRPDSWFVSVTADLWYLGFFWLAGISCGLVCTMSIVLDYNILPYATTGFVFTWLTWALITAWWIWEIVAAKRYRVPLGTSLVRLVEQQERRPQGMAMVNVEGGEFRPLPEHESLKPLTVDLDTVAKGYLLRDGATKPSHPPPPWPYDTRT